MCNSILQAPLKSRKYKFNATTEKLALEFGYALTVKVWVDTDTNFEILILCLLAEADTNVFLLLFILLELSFIHPFMPGKPGNTNKSSL